MRHGTRQFTPGNKIQHRALSTSSISTKYYTHTKPQGTTKSVRVPATFWQTLHPMNFVSYFSTHSLVTISYHLYFIIIIIIVTFQFNIFCVMKVSCFTTIIHSISVIQCSLCCFLLSPYYINQSTKWLRLFLGNSTFR